MGMYDVEKEKERRRMSIDALVGLLRRC